MYSSGDSGLDNVNFNINFTFLQFSILPISYSINLNTLVQNIAPVFNTSKVDAAGTVFYLPNNSGVGGEPAAPGPTNFNNSDGSNSTLTKATNGSNISNTNFNTGVSWALFVKNDTMFKTTGFVIASSIEGLSLSLQVNNDQCIFSIGDVNSAYTVGNIEIEIRATDQNGTGLTTVISQFDVRITE